jgi:hypothetical protein
MLSVVKIARMSRGWYEGSQGETGETAKARS